MKEKDQVIILISIIGTILSEYKDNEVTPAIGAIKFLCQKFMERESGVKIINGTPRVVDVRSHSQFVKTVIIGDSIWKKALDKYAKDSIVIDAVSIVQSVYDFAPAIIAKHSFISKDKMNRYANEGKDSQYEHKITGCVVGGHLNRLLAEEMGIKINGSLQALRKKVERDIA